MKVRPLSDWLVVACDPHQQKSSIIELPSNESAIRTGTVVEVGPGKPLNKGGRIPMGVEKGEKIAFLRWHAEHRPGKAATHALADMSQDVGAECVLIRLADIQFVYMGDVRVDLP